VLFPARARVFGRDHAYWYRVEVALSRYSIAGAALRRAAVPGHLQTDVHHRRTDALRQRGTGRFARNNSSSILVLISAPDLDSGAEHPV
jgi:hypothetical protein